MSLQCPPLLWVTTSKIINVASRNISVGTILTRRRRVREPTAETRSKPRMLPVVHQIAGPHNSQYFTPYPQLTKEEMEEPPPPVSNKVRKVLQLSRGHYEGTKYIRPQIDPRDFQKLRKKMIIDGHVFPDEPLRDRFLEPMVVVEDWIIKKEERLKKVEANMAKMPEWIAEYKEKRRLEREASKAKKDEVKNRNWKHFQEKREKIMTEGTKKKDDKGTKKVQGKANTTA